MSSHQIVYDFDAFAEGEVVTDQLASLGLRLSLGGAGPDGPRAYSVGAAPLPGAGGRALVLGDSTISGLADLTIEREAPLFAARFFVLDAEEAFSVTVLRGTTAVDAAITVTGLGSATGSFLPVFGGPISGPVYRVDIMAPSLAETFDTIVLDIIDGNGPEWIDTLTVTPVQDLRIAFGNGGNANTWLLPGMPLGVLPLPPPTLSNAGALSTPDIGGPFADTPLFGGGVVADTEQGFTAFTVTGQWNSVKNARALSDTAEALVFDGFVHVDAAVGLTDTEGSAVLVLGAKRGNVVTGAGDDVIEIATASNTQDWSNTFRVASGAGDDTILITGFDRDLLDRTPTYTEGPGASLETSGRFATLIVDAGAGDDVIQAGRGRDLLIGGEGADRFVWTRYVDATPGAQRDEIRDFVSGEDVIDLSQIDARPLLPGPQQLSFVGDAPASAGQISASVTAEGMLLRVNLNGNPAPEMEILLRGALSVAAEDFLFSGTALRWWHGPGGRVMPPSAHADPDAHHPTADASRLPRERPRRACRHAG